MGYSSGRNAALLERMLPPNNMTISQLSQQGGIAASKVHKWRAEAFRTSADLLEPMADSIGPHVLAG